MARRDYIYSRRQGMFVKRKTRAAVDYDKYATPQWALLLSFFRWYPDILEDICEGERAEYSNSLMNRVTKRYMARYGETFTFATRGFGKTTCIVSDKCNKGILWPGEITGYYAPSEKQAAPLASKAFRTYSRNVPLLAAHWDVNSNSREHFKISTRSNSMFIMDIDRGLDTSGVVAEECAQEDGNTTFDFSEFNQIVLGTNRLQHIVNGKVDPSHKDSQIHYISSCSRKENPSYAEYLKIRKKMMNGEDAYALSIPWEVPVLLRMKNLGYYKMLKGKLTPDQFARECESKCTGNSSNPVLADQYVQDARTLRVMEDKSSGDVNARYYIGYDVAYRPSDGGNAKCAECVTKTYVQKDGTFSKEVVYISDLPSLSAMEQARRLKERWAQYYTPGAEYPILSIDSWQFGDSVVQLLHTDLGDGLPPFCTIDNDSRYDNLVMQGAIPCIYALYATPGREGKDPNVMMLEYTVKAFETHNVALLTVDMQSGVRDYKLKHNIKDDLQDNKIYIPYLKTQELTKQIANLQRKMTSAGWTQTEISKRMNKDLWSALEYSFRPIKMHEEEMIALKNRRNNGYYDAVAAMPQFYAPVKTRAVKRLGRGAIR